MHEKWPKRLTEMLINVCAYIFLSHSIFASQNAKVPSKFDYAASVYLSLSLSMGLLFPNHSLIAAFNIDDGGCCQSAKWKTSNCQRVEPLVVEASINHIVVEKPITPSSYAILENLNNIWHKILLKICILAQYMLATIINLSLKQLKTI